MTIAIFTIDTYNKSVTLNVLLKFIEKFPEYIYELERGRESERRYISFDKEGSAL